jgi:glycosyltransferase involved in cell wall biosynthesis
VEVVEPDPRGLAEAVLDLARDPSHAGRLRDAGRALAARSTWPRIAQTHIQIYEQLLAASPLSY